MKKNLLTILSLGIVMATQAQFVVFQENFDNLNTALANGWKRINMSTPVGTSDWHQGNGSDVGVTAYNGDTTSYVVADYNAITGAGVISDWLLSPALTFTNGDTISFYTISYNSHTYPDRLEVRISTTDTSSNVGLTAVSVGDFTNNVITVNPNLDTVSYPSVAVEGLTWTRFTGVISGLSGQEQGRIAFRYYVTDGGPAGNNSSTIGLDAVSLISSSNIGFPTELDVKLSIFPNPSSDIVNISMDKNIDATLQVIDMHGKLVKVQNFNSTNSLVDISSLAAGNYIFTIKDNQSGKFISRTITKK